MNTPAAPAGWYRDPSDGSRDRWWDGTQWHAQWRALAAPAPTQPPSQPAGWYPDGSGATRYWDGHAWTPHVAPAAMRASRSPSFWWALAAAALMVVGGLGPWATAFRTINVSGTSGGDGWLVVAAGAIAAAVLLMSRGRAGGVIGLLAALAGGAVGAVDLSDIQSRSVLVQPGWGIYVVIAGSVALGIASLTLLFKRKP